ncbi:MAG: DUF2769 domain-containing protein [Candidatus Bathyarchaeia archaeon]
MDKFGQIMQQMAGLTDEERMQMVESKKELCICGDCPSYNDCASESRELLHCALGKSSYCIVEETGCICPSCPVTGQMGLKYEYFCTRGSEREQRRM